MKRAANIRPTLNLPCSAHQVVKLAREHADADFVVHCEAGISRSPGVALALHEILTGDPPGATLEQRYSLHNRFVAGRCWMPAMCSAGKGGC